MMKTARIYWAPWSRRRKWERPDWSVCFKALRPSLRENLEQQAAVYEQIAQEALSLAAGRNWQVEQLGPVARTCSRMVSRARMGGAILTPRRLPW